MNNNKSIFNISIVEMMLILFFMYIFISVYQLSYKTNQIDELNQIVESQREITQEIVKKNYPELKDKINDLVNLEKYKKLNNDLNNKNSGIDYFKNKISDNIKNANRLKDYREYDNLLKEKSKLHTNILKLKSNKLTINILNEQHQQNVPLHKQIKYLEKKVKDNYQNKLSLSNNLKNLKANEKIKYILLKLNKQHAPIQEQINAIDNQLKKFDKNLLKKDYNLEIDYNNNTKYILENLKQNNKPIQNQINVLKQSLENKKLLLEISRLKKQLINNMKRPKYVLDTSNIQKALDNLQKIKNKTTGIYDPNTKDILRKLNQKNKPLEQQINRLKKQLINNMKRPKYVLDKNNIKKALNDLKKIKDNTSGIYDPNTKDILKELNQIDKPIDEQINSLQNKLKPLDKNNIKKALDNLKKIKDNTSGIYDPNTKDILKELNQKNKPIDEQINSLQNKLKPLDKNNIKKALNDLKEIKDNTSGIYDPNTKDILKELNQIDKPIDEQINSIQNKLKPLDKNNKLQKQIEDLEKQIVKDVLLNNPKINKKNIQKALDNLENIKNNHNIKNVNTPAENLYKHKLENALDGIKEIQKIKGKLANNKDRKPTINKNIEKTIKYLEDKVKHPNLKANKDIQITLDKFNINDVPTTKQLSDLYLNLYSTPLNNTNISELNFVIDRLKDQNDLENKVKYINNILEKVDNPTNTFLKGIGNSKDNNSEKEIATLKNKIKYLQKKLEKSGVVHLPCLVDNEGSTLYLFKLFLRDDNLHIQPGWQEGIAEISKDIPNLDKLIDKTMSLKKFMKLTKPIFEQTIKDECRHFVYFEDETLSKKEYKRKTLTIQHHFYKYIDHTW